LLHERVLASLIERVDQTIGEATLKPDIEIIFSKCERTDYPAILKAMIAEIEGSKLAIADWQRIARAIVEMPNHRSGLQLADLIVSSCFHGIHITGQNSRPNRYQMILSPMLEII
jgi:hypothetical protein